MKAFQLFAAGAVGSLIGLGIAVPAKATIVYVEYSGVVTSVDAGQNQSFIGESWKSDFKFDTTLGAVQSSATNNFAFGGTTNGNPPGPALSAFVTIGGTTTFTVPLANSIYNAFDVSIGKLESSAQNQGDTISLFSRLIDDSNTFPIAFGASIDVTNSNDLSIGNYCDHDVCIHAALTGVIESAAPIGASTPIPAALPLFASGLAGMGWLARRKRKQAA